MITLTLSSGLAGVASLSAAPTVASVTASSAGLPLWAYGVCGSLLGAGGGCLAGLSSARRAWKKSCSAAAKAVASTDDPLPPTLLTSCGNALGTTSPRLQQRLKAQAQAQSGCPSPARAEDAPTLYRGLAELTLDPQLDERAFVGLLRRLVSQSWYLQNDPKRRLVPDERRAATIVQDELVCFSRRYGGPLDVQELVADPNQPTRTNLKVVYTPPEAPEADFATVTFITHFDVLPPRMQARRERNNSFSTSSLLWAQGQRDPFQLTRLDGKLYGCGTSSGLGHVALLTQLFCTLGRRRPRLRCRVVAFFLAASQGGEAGLGADWLLASHKLQESYLGPLCWLGVPGSRLCCSTTGVLGWSLRVAAQRGANSINLASKALSHLQAGFAKLFPKLPTDEEFGYSAGSTMRPTHVRCHTSPLSEAVVDGEIHVTPTYRVTEVVTAVEALVEEFCKDSLAQSSWEEGEDASPGGGFPGKVELSWSDRPDNKAHLRTGKRSRSVESLTSGRSGTSTTYLGLAEDLEGLHVNCSSQGHFVLAEALGEVCGEESARPCSVQGSVPHARRLKEAGLDVQLCGFGVQEWHFQEAEFCLLLDMRRGFRVLLRVVETYGQMDLESEEFSRQPSDESTFSPDSWANTVNGGEEGTGVGSQTAFEWCSSLLPQTFPLSPLRAGLNSSSPALAEDSGRRAELRIGRSRSWSMPTSGPDGMEKTIPRQARRHLSLNVSKTTARDRGRLGALQLRSPSLSPLRRPAEVDWGAEADWGTGSGQEKQEPQELLSPLRPRRLAVPRRHTSSPPTQTGLRTPAASSSQGSRRAASPSCSHSANRRVPSEVRPRARQRSKHPIWQPPAMEDTGGLGESCDVASVDAGEPTAAQVTQQGEEEEEVGWLGYLGAVFSLW